MLTGLATSCPRPVLLAARIGQFTQPHLSGTKNFATLSYLCAILPSIDANRRFRHVITKTFPVFLSDGEGSEHNHHGFEGTKKR